MTEGDRGVGEIEGVDEPQAESLRDEGYETVGDLRDASEDDLIDVDGIGEVTAETLLSAADAESDDEAAEADDADETGDESSGEADDDGESAGADDAADGDGDEDAGSDGGDGVGLVQVRDTASDAAIELIGRELDGVISVSRDGDEWRAEVEVIERKSIPDTQDILGRYEFDIDDSGRVVGYRRIDRYRRTEGASEEF